MPIHPGPPSNQPNRPRSLVAAREEGVASGEGVRRMMVRNLCRVKPKLRRAHDRDRDSFWPRGALHQEPSSPISHRFFLPSRDAVALPQVIIGRFDKVPRRERIFSRTVMSSRGPGNCPGVHPGTEVHEEPLSGLPVHSEVVTILVLIYLRIGSEYVLPTILATLPQVDTCAAPRHSLDRVAGRRKIAITRLGWVGRKAPCPDSPIDENGDERAVHFADIQGYCELFDSMHVSELTAPCSWTKSIEGGTQHGRGCGLSFSASIATISPPKLAFADVFFSSMSTSSSTKP